MQMLILVLLKNPKSVVLENSLKSHANQVWFAGRFKSLLSKVVNIHLNQNDELKTSHFLFITNLMFLFLIHKL